MQSKSKESVVSNTTLGQCITIPLLHMLPFQYKPSERRVADPLQFGKCCVEYRRKTSGSILFYNFHVVMYHVTKRTIREEKKNRNSWI
jgi:hypothetical protein